MAAMTRREFIKWGAGGVAFFTSGLPIEVHSAPRERGKSVSRSTGRFRKSIPSVCMMCPASCGIIGYLEYGKLVNIGGNPLDPNSCGKVCAKGVAGINHLYNPDRLLFPLKRAGKRGEGRWKRVSWDEALDEVALRLKSIRTEKEEGVAIRNTWDLSSNGMARRFADAFGSLTVLQNGSVFSPNGTFTFQGVSGHSVCIGDVAHAQYLLNFGANPYESHFLYVPFIQRLIDSRINLGAKLVTFEVRMSQTAGKSDEWFPIIPGTDGVVALAMAHVIANEGMWDKDFLEEKTDMNPLQLLRHLAPYTPHKAESLSGVKASDLKRIAIEFATTKPALAIGGGGVLKHVNGASTLKSILLLNAMVGSLGGKGGFFFPQRYPLEPPDPKPPSRSKRMNPESLDLFLGVHQGRERIGVLITHMDNPVYRGPHSKLISNVLQEEEKTQFHVSIDSFLNETNLYADMVLPEATYLERWDLLSPPSMEHVPYLALRQPIVKPLGESLPFSDILIELALRVGGGMERFFRFGKSEHYIEAMIQKIPELVEAGGIDLLMEKGIWFDRRLSLRDRSRDQKISKPLSGKFKFNPLPAYVPIPHHQRLSEDEFHLTTFQWNVHSASLTANCKWLMEIVHRNPLWINTESAKKIGLREGDRVRITSTLGSLVTPIFITQGIHPKVVALSDSLGRWSYGRISRGQPFQSEDPDTNLIRWGRRGTGVHPNSIIPAQPDPSGGGQGWMDTVVKVEKV